MSEKLSNLVNDQVVSYLKNPVSNGLFKLKAQQTPSKSIIKKIQNSTSSSIEVSRAYFPIERFNSARDILTLFRESTVSDDQMRRSIFKEIESLVGNVEQKLQKSYEELKNEYTAKIGLSSFNDRLISRSIFQAKSGIFIDQSKEKDFRSQRIRADNVEFVSFARQPLDDLSKFLMQAGIIDNPRVYTVYSPDEEVMESYVDAISILVKRRDTDMPSSIASKFTKLIDDYDNGNYSGCASTAGLIGEEILTQVYETLKREPVPKRIMLGSLHSNIADFVKTTIKPAKKKDFKSHTEIMDSTKKLLKDSKTDKALIAAVKEILSYTDRQNVLVAEQINELSNNEKRQNNVEGLYPSIVLDGIEDIIQFRNSVSHRSSDNINSLKALKCAHGCFNLFNWWTDARLLVDSSDDHKETIKKIIRYSEKY